MGMSRLLTGDSLRYYLTGESTIDRPIGWELSLHTGDPGVDGLDNEVTDSAYERQPITMAVVEPVDASPHAYNDTVVSFPPAASGYTVTHVVLWDSQGNVLVPQSLRVPKEIIATEQAHIAVGEFTIGELG